MTTLKLQSLEVLFTMRPAMDVPSDLLLELKKQNEFALRNHDFGDLDPLVVEILKSSMRSEILEIEKEIAIRN